MIDRSQPQRISLRYAIPFQKLKQSISFAEVEAMERLAKQMCSYLIKECMTKRLETDGVVESNIFELNGYFVTPQALEKLVQERVHKIQSGYPIVDFY
jgi:hypothetical protein